MNTRNLLVSVLTALIMMLAILAMPSAAFASNQPPGSSRIQFFKLEVNDFFVIPANVVFEDVTFCPFDVEQTATGWIQFRDYFDKAGNWILGVETDHIIYTEAANGKSFSDLFVRTKKLYADDITNNPDGTITFIQTWAGHASLVQDVGADVGRITFSLTIDPNTGQELDFQILHSDGQNTGLWGGPQSSVDAMCAKLAP